MLVRFKLLHARDVHSTGFVHALSAADHAAVLHDAVCGVFVRFACHAAVDALHAELVAIAELIATLLLSALLAREWFRVAAAALCVTAHAVVSADLSLGAVAA